MMGHKIKIRLSGNAIEADLEFTLTMQIVTLTDIPLFYLYEPSRTFRTSAQKDFQIEIDLPDLALMPGSYYLNVWVGRIRKELFDHVKYIASFDILQSETACIPHRINQKLGPVYGNFLARQLR